MIHQYKMGGMNIVVDVFSGSIHAVDDVAFDIIGIYEQKPKAELIDFILDKYKNNSEVTRKEVEDCYDQIGELKNTGKLFSKDTFAPMAAELKKRTSGVVKALCLHVAHTCNLNCSYCFASQ